MSSEVSSFFMWNNKLFSAASRNSRMVSALTRTQLQDGYVAYPWGRKMQEFLSVPNSSCFLSILLLPKSSDRAASRYNDLEDTLARANAWLTASQSAGVPVVFMNIHTESLLTKVSSQLLIGIMIDPPLFLCSLTYPINIRNKVLGSSYTSKGSAGLFTILQKTLIQKQLPTFTFILCWETDW